MSILQRHASGVHILPMPARMIEEVNISPEVIEKVIKLTRSYIRLHHHRRRPAAEEEIAIPRTYIG